MANEVAKNNDEVKIPRIPESIYQQLQTFFMSQEELSKEDGQAKGALSAHGLSTKEYDGYVLFFGTQGENKDKIVAVRKDNVLTTFLKCKPYSEDKRINHHHEIVSLVLAKDMKFYYGDKVVQQDAVVFYALCGTATHMERRCDSLVLDSKSLWLEGFEDERIRRHSAGEICNDDFGTLAIGEDVYKQIVAPFGIPEKYAYSQQFVYDNEENRYYFPAGEPRETNLSGKEMGQKLFAWLLEANSRNKWPHSQHDEKTRSKVYHTTKTNLAIDCPLHKEMRATAAKDIYSPANPDFDWQDLEALAVVLHQNGFKLKFGKGWYSFQERIDYQIVDAYCDSKIEHYDRSKIIEKVKDILEKGQNGYDWTVYDTKENIIEDLTNTVDKDFCVILKGIYDIIKHCRGYLTSLKTASGNPETQRIVREISDVFMPEYSGQSDSSKSASVDCELYGILMAAMDMDRNRSMRTMSSDGYKVSRQGSVTGASEHAKNVCDVVGSELERMHNLAVRLESIEKTSDKTFSPKIHHVVYRTNNLKEKLIKISQLLKQHNDIEKYPEHDGLVLKSNYWSKKNPSELGKKCEGDAAIEFHTESAAAKSIGIEGLCDRLVDSIAEKIYSCQCDINSRIMKKDKTQRLNIGEDLGYELHDLGDKLGRSLAPSFHYYHDLDNSRELDEVTNLIGESKQNLAKMQEAIKSIHQTNNSISKPEFEILDNLEIENQKEWRPSSRINIVKTEDLVAITSFKSSQADLYFKIMQKTIADIERDLSAIKDKTDSIAKNETKPTPPPFKTQNDRDR